MNYTFSTFATVPAEMIREIGMDILRAAMKRLEAEGGEMTDVRLADIEYQFTNAILDVISKSDEQTTVSVDGFHLPPARVLEIAEYLRIDRFVDAVRAFRDYTNCGLREAKEFIERFGRRGHYSAQQFIDTFR